MSDFLLGLIVIFLDFSLGFGDHYIGLLPDVLGYVFLLNGLKKVQSKSPVFVFTRSVVAPLTAVTAFTYMADLFALLKNYPILQWLSGLAEVAGGIAVAFLLVRGFADVERVEEKDFQVRHLMTMWLATACVQGVTFFTTNVLLLGLVCTVASCIVMIIFLVAFHRTEKLAKPYLY